MQALAGIVAQTCVLRVALIVAVVAVVAVVEVIATRPTNKPDLCIPLENLVFRIVFRCEKLVFRVFH